MATDTGATTAEDDEEWTYPHIPKHQHLMASLMSFKDGRWDNKYHRSTVFSKEQLLQLRPIDIKRWLTMRAFGKVNPDWATDRPDKERSGSLAKAKHGVSLFMPNRHVAWLEGRGGNPTQHQMVSKLISDIQAKETKGEGKKANDKRPYRQIEFDKLLEILRNKDCFDEKFKFPTMTLWAYHLIHRIDDTAHFKASDPHGSQLQRALFNMDPF